MQHPFQGEAPGDWVFVAGHAPPGRTGLALVSRLGTLDRMAPAHHVAAVSLARLAAGLAVGHRPRRAARPTP